MSRFVNWLRGQINFGLVAFVICLVSGLSAVTALVTADGASISAFGMAHELWFIVSAAICFVMLILHLPTITYRGRNISLLEYLWRQMRLHLMWSGLTLMLVGAVVMSIGFLWANDPMVNHAGYVAGWITFGSGSVCMALGGLTTFFAALRVYIPPIEQRITH